ncbi:MAG: PorP/SprF family type IX secretion system membrane protein [Vicingaceae bacterium]|nr:PorP/SprF family type IX secretion system membrane protein [Flavobacteriales bacterium]MDF1675661.1 PorP/SprF family type IX secretion system membrane protein [Vicingaceae bacterium]
MKKLLISISMCFVSSIFAQDIHLSQTHMTPLLVNPANAGSEYTMRGILNYRSQWGSVTTPFNTMMASFDMNFKPKNSSKKGYFAGGVYFFNDKAGESQTKTTQANLSVAYHVNVNDKNTLGLGVQGGYFQRSTSIASLKWGSQYDGFQYNSTLTSNEGNGSDNLSFGTTDYTSGIVWTYRNDENYLSGKKLLINSGISMHHLTKPDFEFQNVFADQLHYRWIWHANAIVGVSPKFTVLPYLFYSRQGAINEIMFGSNVLYKFKEESKYTQNVKGMAMGGGLFYRWNDAVVAMLCFEIDNYNLTFSYDVNTSSLNDASGGQGAYEIAFRYVYPNPFGGVKSKARFN